METKVKVHVFESAGLGKAPFRFFGIEERRGPIEISPGRFVGSPGQPMGVCDFCGESIVECCHIVSSDGKHFVVGNVCVGKTGDEGLKLVVEKAVRERRTEALHRKQDAVIESVKTALADSNTRQALSSQPHPYEWLAKRGLTRLDWSEWMMKNAGRKGRCDVGKWLQANNFMS